MEMTGGKSCWIKNLKRLYIFKHITKQLLCKKISKYKLIKKFI